jgi:5-dehydro-4-deoxyglucarate dehydratase
MASRVTPHELKAMLTTGLLSFPLTDFDDNDAFDPAACARRLQWLAKYDSGPLFMAGGAGEFFSLTQTEYSAVIKTAVDVVGTHQPVVAGTGYGTRMAIAFAQEAERLGAAGLLLMAPYLAEGSQTGLRAHVAAVCKATRLGVIVYNRANCRLTVETLSRLAEDCPNLIGFKDGVGDIPQLVAVRAAIGDRLAYLNGMPTAETYAPAFRAIGIPTYSSAIFNFIPRTAIRFHRALATGDQATVDHLMTSFLVPYVRLRGRQPGYAVSIVKAGARIVGRGAGAVRPPLSELTPAEYEELAALIATLGPQD